MVDSSQPDGRFVALVLRDLKADHVRFLPAHTPLTDAENTLSARLPDGRTVVVTFAEKPDDRDALSRRLGMLAQSFAQSFVAEGEARVSQSAHPRSLHEELRALAARAIAKDALVIDAHSPVVWGSASGLAAQTQAELEEVPHDVSAPVLASGPSSHDWSEESGPLPDDPDTELSVRAATAVRALVDENHVKNGKPFGHTFASDELGYVAHGFSGIYILILVYPTLFDEMRAHRSISESMARIERLVMALPPLDPTPSTGAGVVRLRRRR
jgi:hypothetical protein